MGSIQTLSSVAIKILNSTEPSDDDIIDLTPWDLQMFSYGPIQKGLLYHNPVDLHTRANQIHRLKQSLSSTLAFFPTFAGRLQITKHQDDNTVSCSIVCNNAGALFVHATAKNTCVSDILGLSSPILYSFFPLNGIKNYQGTSHSLLAVQVTELLDGIFIAFTVNHAVADGTSTWHFINSWAHISNSSTLQIPKLPSFQRWFPDTTPLPIRFPFNFDTSIDENKKLLNYPYLPEQLFHFPKAKIVELKAKANLEVGQNKISSLQALFTHIWRCVTRSKRLDLQEEVSFQVTIGVRSRLVPPLARGYFGNATVSCVVTMKVGELLEEGGFGKGALEMNKMIALYSDQDKLENHYESWLRTPSFAELRGGANSNRLIISSSPLFDIYGNDFGWGKPVEGRSGGANKINGKISVYAGADEGSMDLEVCLPYDILEAIRNDPEFMGTDFTKSCMIVKHGQR